MSRPPRVPAYPITAYSVCCALGLTRSEVAASLREGRGGLTPASAVAPAGIALPFRTHVGAVPGELPALPDALAAYDTRTARLSCLALTEVAPQLTAACERWGSERVGLVIGGSTAGMASTEQAYRYYVREGQMPSWWSSTKQHDFSAVLDVLRALTPVRGPGLVVSTACSSSGKAFASAQRMLASGRVDAVLVGGVDTLCELTLRGFQSLGILAQEVCRPFSSQRDGISIGEGAALFVLEREASSKLALFGCGESADAYHMTAPHPQGLGAEQAMRAALDAAGLAPEQIGHVNAHGTGTPQNDSAEALALGRVLGARVPTLSTKGYTGHALGSAGAIEAALALLCVQERYVPPSLHCEPLDPAIELDIVTSRRALQSGYVLSNSFAFGGSNVSVLLGEAS